MASFGTNWENDLELVGEPVGVGAVAQVYRGYLHHNGEKTEVAVKILHPDITVVRKLRILSAMTFN